MLVYLVDPNRDNVVLQELDIEKGLIRVREKFFVGKDYSTTGQSVNLLIERILKFMPDQVVIDRQGLGLSFYDEFVNQIVEYSHIVHIDITGKLAYPTTKTMLA